MPESTALPGGALPTIELVQPLPGFPELREFALVELDERGLLCELQSLSRPEVRFLVVPPGRFFPDYVVEVDDSVAADLGATRAEDVLVLVLVTVGSSLSSSTANLVAPVLVHTGSRRAQQVVLDDPALSLAAPLGS